MDENKTDTVVKKETQENTLYRVPQSYATNFLSEQTLVGMKS